jgi:acetyl esterase
MRTNCREGVLIMPIHPELADLLARIPPMPPLEQMGIDKLRERAAAGIARAQKLDVALQDIRDFSIPGPARDIPVRHYLPVGLGPFPLVVYAHGGGYVLGDLDISDAICRAIASGAGAAVLSIDYRLAPEHPFPAGLEDTWAAVTWALGHPRELGARPDAIFVAGDSAGANLMAAVALRARDAGVALAGQILLYGSPDYPDTPTASTREYGDGPLLRASDSQFYWSHYLADPADKDNPMAAPARATRHDGLAAALVITGECDPSRDLGERYASILEHAGTPTTLRRYQGMPHGFLTYIAHSQAVSHAMADICAWIVAESQSTGKARQ